MKDKNIYFSTIKDCATGWALKNKKDGLYCSDQNRVLAIFIMKHQARARRNEIIEHLAKLGIKEKPSDYEIVRIRVEEIKENKK